MNTSSPFRAFYQHLHMSMSGRFTKEIHIDDNGLDHLEEVLALNRLVFNENRLINRMDHKTMLFLTAHCDGQLAGFKIGYGINRDIFYSAKSATSPLFRRCGVATKLLFAMMSKAATFGFREIQYDTFPVKYPGMVVLGLKNGFQIKRLTWNQEYDDYQIRLSRPIK